MDNNQEIKGLDYVIASSNSQIIKVIGVGGGGGNAVNYMYKQGIKDVSFIICNTDRQALENSPIKTKVLLGQGLGAGNRPEKAKMAAEASQVEIGSCLDANTEMVFVTATMGGGTGTGAAPIVAKYAKEQDILTVGVVTVPFAWEGRNKRKQAYKGVVEMHKYVDALLVIQNEKLREVYPTIGLENSFDIVNEVLNQAVKGIAEMVTVHGRINLDFADVNTTLKNGGFALMNTGVGTGEHRIRKALEDAINSPLIQDSNVRRAKKILMNLHCPKNLMLEETQDIDDFFDEMLCDDIDVIWGLTVDETLGDEVKITLVVTGFGSDIITGLDELNDNYEIDKLIEKTVKPKEIVRFSDLDDEACLEKIVNEPAYKRR